jgi:hypothetical protein
VGCKNRQTSCADAGVKLRQHATRMFAWGGGARFGKLKRRFQLGEVGLDGSRSNDAVSHCHRVTFTTC